MVDIASLNGKRVIGVGGLHIGEVKGAEVNPNTWQVTHLQVKLSSQAAEELGYKKLLGSATLCMPVYLISAIGDVITLNKTLEEIRHNSEFVECPT